MAEKTEVQAALDAVEGQYVSDKIDTPDGGFAYFAANGVNGMKVHSFPPLNPVLPEHISRQQAFGDLDSLAEYSNIYKAENTRAFLNANAPKFRVHFDYHDPAKGRQHDEHVAEFKPMFHPDYQKWGVVLGQAIDQEAYAEFIEDMMHTIAEPSAAVLLDAIKDFEIGTDIRFKKVLNDRTGNASIVYEQEDRELTTELPRNITLVLPLFLGADPVSLGAMVSYRAVGGTLKFVIKAPGMDKLERDVIEDMAEEFKSRTTIPLYVVP